MAPHAATRLDRSRGHHYRLLIGGLVFIVVGTAMIANGNTDVIGGTAFCAAGIGVSAWQLWPRLFETERRSPEALLATYPGPVVLHGSIRKSLLLAAVGGLLGASLLWMPLPQPIAPMLQIVFWPGAVMLFCMALVMLLVATLGTSLRLDQTGLTIRQPWRRIVRRWPEIDDFVVGAISDEAVGASWRFVAFEDTKVGETRSARMSRTICGRNAALPDTLGLQADALATLLNAWRTRALRDGAEQW